MCEKLLVKFACMLQAKKIPMYFVSDCNLYDGTQVCVLEIRKIRRLDVSALFFNEYNRQREAPSFFQSLDLSILGGRIGEEFRIHPMFGDEMETQIYERIRAPAGHLNRWETFFLCVKFLLFLVLILLHHIVSTLRV